MNIVYCRRRRKKESKRTSSARFSPLKCEIRRKSCKNPKTRNRNNIPHCLIIKSVYSPSLLVNNGAGLLCISFGPKVRPRLIQRKAIVQGKTAGREVPERLAWTSHVRDYVSAKNVHIHRRRGYRARLS